MSGGSLNYVYSSVEEAGYTLSKSLDPLHRAFGNHLLIVATALHDIDWVLSGDYANGDEEESIKAVLGDNWKTIVISTALEQIEEIKQSIIDMVKD